MHCIPSPDWNREFFTHLPNEFWRRVVPPEATEADVAFAVKRLELHAPARVLDIPCGSGRHAMALARLGHRVIGVDASTEAIAHARRHARGEGLDVEFVHGDMRSPPAGLAGLDAAICLGNSLAYLDAQALDSFARDLARLLVPGGGVMLDDGFAAESILPSFDDAERRMSAGGITVRSRNRYDAARGLIVSRYVFQRGAEEFEGEAVHHVLPACRIVGALDAAGFREVRLHDGTSDAGYRPASPRLVVTARRP